MKSIFSRIFDGVNTGTQDDSAKSLTGVGESSPLLPTALSGLVTTNTTSISEVSSKSVRTRAERLGVQKNQIRIITWMLLLEKSLSTCSAPHTTRIFFYEA
jgi:hypothetical protein